jgi:hypothetical protein
MIMYEITFHVLFQYCNVQFYTNSHYLKWFYCCSFVCLRSFYCLFKVLSLLFVSWCHINLHSNLWGGKSSLYLQRVPFAFSLEFCSGFFLLYLIHLFLSLSLLFFFFTFSENIYPVLGSRVRNH